ncbi:unnamed protein product [Rhizoctonia solani]|uniref:Phosphatidylethanolamine N-methyltransferase n=1 Tax=Rhizoctonia solani TaxID=456999 RepID=A0A8H3HTD4_9AGAM|nr:unnamed protein product [Rhizoctonia solani]
MSKPFSYEYGHLCFKLLISCLNISLLERWNDLDETRTLFTQHPDAIPQITISNMVAKGVLNGFEALTTGGDCDWALGWSAPAARRRQTPLLSQSDISTLLDVLWDDRKLFIRAHASTDCISGGFGLSGLMFLFTRYLSQERAFFPSPGQGVLGNRKYELLLRYSLVASKNQRLAILSYLDIPSRCQEWMNTPKHVDIEDSRLILNSFIKQLSEGDDPDILAKQDPSMMLRFVSLAIDTSTQDLLPEVLRWTIQHGWSSLLGVDDMAAIDTLFTMHFNSMSWLIRPPHNLPAHLTSRTREQIISAVIDGDFLDWTARMMLRLNPEHFTSKDMQIVTFFFSSLAEMAPQAKLGHRFQDYVPDWQKLKSHLFATGYASFALLAWKTYSSPTEWTVGDQLLRHTLGVLLLGLHLWAALQTFEVLGVFGWFFGDFFISDYPAQLSYTGIYRFMNNPERTMSGASLFGLALISGSRAVFALAVISMGAHWWFLSFVERPHMKKLYGDSIRKEAGLTKTLKNVAKKNANVARVAHEVSGTFEKVYGEAAEAVENFLSRSGPMISEVVQDTRILLQQSKEKLVITRVADDLSSFDVNKYRMSVVPTSTAGDLRFHIGEPIRVAWHAPPGHSKRDWIGIYRVGANSSNLVTKINSQGMWIPIHDDQWDGDAPISHDKHALPDSGEVVFQKDQLPWQLRYHHDGKYNVMNIAGPIEIYVNKPETNDFESVRDTLLRIVTLCLDSDPSLVPLSAGIDPISPSQDPGSKSTQPTGLRSDPDDFRFWSERQAKRITTAVYAAFGVEYSPEVIVADANVTALSNRVINSLKLLGQNE